MARRKRKYQKHASVHIGRGDGRIVVTIYNFTDDKPLAELRFTPAEWGDLTSGVVAEAELDIPADVESRDK